jgi:hypothetical protein
VARAVGSTGKHHINQLPPLGEIASLSQRPEFTNSDLSTSILIAYDGKSIVFLRSYRRGLPPPFYDHH